MVLDPYPSFKCIEEGKGFCESVFRIRDILVRIRMRIRIRTFDYPLTDPAPDPALFVSDLQDASKKFFFFSKFLCLFLFEGMRMRNESFRILNNVNTITKKSKEISR